ncbi:MAG: histidinol-phosphate transaminase [Oscillospiraceae bacterium]|nr:histidinol-phosphate transaminase [Oscillospiraceae bacterium]
MSRFFSDKFKTLKPYIPGEQPKSDALSPLGLPYIKLNTNESPYPPPPGVISAVSKKELELQRLYPNPEGALLVSKLAKHYGVLPENIMIGNGSDELLAFSFLAFFTGSRGGVLFPDITYGFYPVYAELFDVPYTALPLGDDFTVNINDYIGSGKNIVLANPNAPTGIALCASDIEKIAKSNQNQIVLIDEAYVDFGAESAVSLISKYDNLLVIHTYSKARSMAGARLAYAIASAPIISDLMKIKYSINSYNVNRLAQTMGAAALDEDLYYKEKQTQIIKTRKYTMSELEKFGFIMTDSKANFIFAKHPSLSGDELYIKLKARGILIRHWNKPRIADYVRITIGTKEQMDALISEIREILR